MPDPGPWPELEWQQSEATAETLHLYMQIVGKTRLALTPVQNHWWNTALYLSARGLIASTMPVEGGALLDIEFDFLSHEVICRVSGGAVGKIALRSIPVVQFFQEFADAILGLGMAVRIDRMPVEAVSPIRCDLDTVHCTYDPDAVGRFWHVLRIADMPPKRFSTNFYDKISPVHFFWGSFDLAATRFSGPRAPARAGADAIQAEAYSHEVISAGFWPGNGGYGQAAFYAYATPTPEGPEQTTWNTGRFDPVLREFILDYDDARTAPDPIDTVLEFLYDTYSSAADAARWDRTNLDRTDDISRAVRLKSPRSQENRHE
jgi:Family of unknown function (DUF5996)